MDLYTDTALIEPYAAAPPPLDEPHRSRFVSLAAVLAAALVGAAIGTTATLAVGGRGQPPVVRVAAPSSARTGLTGAAAVAAEVLPSVVRIDVSSRSAFGRSASGTGSGVIYRSDGYIITNDHVVDGADTVQVTLSSGEKLPARVIGTAMPSDDIAVVKVDRTGLAAATLGSTSGLHVGDLAVAVGSPFGLEGTVTAGVVSALHRNIELGQEERFTDAIQTDAPINPGNSGGALASATGAVIGINTAIVGGGSGNVGVGFAIPIDIARRDADQIVSSGHASRPFLGISGENVPNGGGALVQGLEAGGPAAQAGLKVGDRIVGIDGTKVTSMDDLVSALSKLDVGKAVDVTFVREGKRETVAVTLGRRQ
jgi:putative serine protease PepD